MLMALDLPLPHKVFGHGWLVIDGGKISKSLGNYKDPREYINDYGVDAVRYFVLREVPFGSDGTFSEEALINRTNGDLANVLGNLVNRTISMANKYFDGTVKNTKVTESIDKELIDLVNDLDSNVEKKMDSLEVGYALECIFEVLRRANKYIDETTPWALAKEEDKKDRLETVIYNLLESIRVCAILLSPFLPDTSESIFKQLNADNRNASFDSDSTYTNMKNEILFARIDKEEK
jgi:methionyl-tRNA synthetase